MVFSTLFFVFFFFVISFALQAFMPNIQKKNLVLLISSLIFYAWGGPLLLLLLCGMTLICWFGALNLSIQKSKFGKRLCLFLTLLPVIGLLCTFKYAGFLVENCNWIFQTDWTVPSIALPIGISFYTFQLLSYVVDVYRGQVKPQRKYWLLLLYASLYHQCIAGPIVRYSDVNEEILHRKTSSEELSKGISRFAVGLVKKAFLANAVAILADNLLPLDDVELLTSLSSASLLVGGLCYMLQIYLDFSAYSDMAIGMGLMIGFHYKENFNYPYISTSVSEFWRRWHISLGSFFRDYVYIPLGGNRCSAIRNIFNLFVVWFLTGLWHGASWNYILWGLYFFCFLLLEKYLFRWKKEIPTGKTAAWRRAYTLAVIYFGWFLFRFEDLSQFALAIKGIVCANGNPFWDTTVWLALKNNLFLLILAILSVTPILPWISRKLSNEQAPVVAKAFYSLLSILAPAGCLLLSLLLLIGDSYNPFLYFQF